MDHEPDAADAANGTVGADPQLVDTADGGELHETPAEEVDYGEEAEAPVASGVVASTSYGQAAYVDDEPEQISFGDDEELENEEEYEADAETSPKAQPETEEDEKERAARKQAEYERKWGKVNKEDAVSADAPDRGKSSASDQAQAGPKQAQGRQGQGRSGQSQSQGQSQGPGGRGMERGGRGMNQQRMGEGVYGRGGAFARGQGTRFGPGHGEGMMGLRRAEGGMMGGPGMMMGMPDMMGGLPMAPNGNGFLLPMPPTFPRPMPGGPPMPPQIGMHPMLGDKRKFDATSGLPHGQPLPPPGRPSHRQRLDEGQRGAGSGPSMPGGQRMLSMGGAGAAPPGMRPGMGPTGQQQAGAGDGMQEQRPVKLRLAIPVASAGRVPAGGLRRVTDHGEARGAQSREQRPTGSGPRPAGVAAASNGSGNSRADALLDFDAGLDFDGPLATVASPVQTNASAQRSWEDEQLEREGFREGPGAANAAERKASAAAVTRPAPAQGPPAQHPSPHRPHPPLHPQNPQGQLPYRLQLPRPHIPGPRPPLGLPGPAASKQGMRPAMGQAAVQNGAPVRPGAAAGGAPLDPRTQEEEKARRLAEIQLKIKQQAAENRKIIESQAAKNKVDNLAAEMAELRKKLVQLEQRATQGTPTPRYRLGIPVPVAALPAEKRQALQADAAAAAAKARELIRGRAAQPDPAPAPKEAALATSSPQQAQHAQHARCEAEPSPAPSPQKEKPRSRREAVAPAAEDFIGFDEPHGQAARPAEAPRHSQEASRSGRDPEREREREGRGSKHVRGSSVEAAEARPDAKRAKKERHNERKERKHSRRDREPASAGPSPSPEPFAEVPPLETAPAPGLDLREQIDAIRRARAQRTPAGEDAERHRRSQTEYSRSSRRLESRR